jgi:hypothetical protein
MCNMLASPATNITPSPQSEKPPKYHSRYISVTTDISLRLSYIAAPLFETKPRRAISELKDATYLSPR